MKFISVSDGFSIRKSSIEAVVKTEDLKCEIRTEANVYKCGYPYSTMLSLLEMENIEENVSNNKTDQLLKVIASNQQRNVA